MHVTSASCTISAETPQDYVLRINGTTLLLQTSQHRKKENRGLAVFNRDLLAVKMTPAQLVEAQNLAREWKPK
jgi:uncharacterized protein